MIPNLSLGEVAGELYDIYLYICTGIIALACPSVGAKQRCMCVVTEYVVHFSSIIYVCMYVYMYIHTYVVTPYGIVTHIKTED